MPLFQLLLQQALPLNLVRRRRINHQLVRVANLVDNLLDSRQVSLRDNQLASRRDSLLLNPHIRRRRSPQCTRRRSLL